MNYEQMKKSYLSATPLRGTNNRPIGRRYRKHELVVEIPSTDPAETRPSYAAKLYDTHCVVYHPDGTFDVDTGGFGTSLTSAFITKHTPISVCCIKMKNTLWLTQFHSKDPKRYPVKDTPTKFRMSDNGNVLEPITPPTFVRKMVDRKKTREFHSRLVPFLDSVKLFLSMADGWVMHETIKQFFSPIEGEGVKHPGFSMRFASHLYVKYIIERSPGGLLPPLVFMYNSAEPFGLQVPYRTNTLMRDTAHAKKFVEFLCELREEDFLYGLCLITLQFADCVIDNRVADQIIQDDPNTGRSVLRYNDYRVDYSKLKGILYKYIASLDEVSKLVSVEPSNKFVSKVA